MNSFYTDKELSEIGFCKIGVNVLISRKASFYGVDRIEIGNNIRIDDFCILSGRIVIGSFVHIAAGTMLYGSTAGIYISDFVNISSRIGIFATSDDYSGNTLTSPLIPSRYKNVDNRPVTIESHVIIGTGCTILPGVTLQEGSSFGAMTLINHDSEPWSINVGIPFKRIRERSRDMLDLLNDFYRDIRE